ncbi:hypothetical protein PVAP13_7KG254900 [Panicum virgatum]|uniref:Uncharacterized protein n=1 Tax=Panicum virgatum TaxID=38727 RepID=A0A8T0QJQ8_PANVG|nr:hypothetical protein PVAP13_7KG254900 [Panicum virgatum]
MGGTIAKKVIEANDAQNIKEPHLRWMIGFMFFVSFVSLFSLVPLRKVMIVDYKPTHPSGTATAYYLINGFHAPQGSKFVCWTNTSHLASFWHSSSGSTQPGNTVNSSPSQHLALKYIKLGQYICVLQQQGNKQF